MGSAAGFTSRRVKATYQKGIFLPEAPCDLPEGAAVELIVQGPIMLPPSVSDPEERARHRAWIEFASATLNDIWGFYTAPDEAAFARKTADLAGKFRWLEQALGEGPYPQPGAPPARAHGCLDALPSRSSGRCQISL